ncbi:hypothetical protein [uncultured Erythrobacter sp.]|uniref:hypothetical protein n=1 Tax=uncultured Erythrobacter sp. TaxID=263913 RepID=UPI00374837C7
MSTSACIAVTVIVTAPHKQRPVTGSARRDASVTAANLSTKERRVPAWRCGW